MLSSVICSEGYIVGLGVFTVSVWLLSNPPYILYGSVLQPFGMHNIYTH